MTSWAAIDLEQQKKGLSFFAAKGHSGEMEVELVSGVSLNGRTEEGWRAEPKEKGGMEVEDEAPLLSGGGKIIPHHKKAAVAAINGYSSSCCENLPPKGGAGMALEWNPPKNKTTATTMEEEEDKSPLLLTNKPAVDASSSEPKSRRNGASVDTLEEMEAKYAAFVRRDTYGAMGKGDLPAQDKAILAAALIIMLPIKLATLLAILITYYIVCRVCTLFQSPNKADDQDNYVHLTGWRRSVIVHTGRFLARSMLFVLGFYHIDVMRNDMNNDEGECKSLENSEQPGAIISNHISYLDILYHMSASFPSFVAKRSVAKLPFVGLISKCIGCIYVQREAKSLEFKGVSGLVSERLQAAYCDKNAPIMMLFPEGTTTNGDFLLPFKTGAFLSQTPVQPVILKYPYKHFSPAWDSISGLRHMVLLLCQFVNHLEVRWLPVYSPSEKEKSDPKLYASNVRELMAREGGLTLSDIGLPEKRIYLAALNGGFVG